MEELTFNLNKSSKKPIYLQLYEYIKNQIIAGNLETSTKMPSIRRLSSYLSISRTTIETTYHQLCVEGYLISKANVGYFVSSIDNNSLNYFSEEREVVLEEENTSLPEVKFDFRNDSLDKESFDFVLWKKYLGKALLKENERLLTYGAHQGEYELRREITRYVHSSRGVVCKPKQIIIGAGVQSLLNILCGIFKPYYTSVGFEDPGFKQGRYVFKNHNYEVIPISLEKDGINLCSLEESGTRIVYVSPSHQFPMGSIMSINKRIKLLKWAQERGGLIIEDDYDSELRYFGRPIPSLQGLNNGNDVIYLGSFSKILLPGIRISYMILPERLISIYQEEMYKYNQTSSQIEQIALALFMQDGQLEKHIRRLRKIYAQKNQMLQDAIKEVFGDKINVIGEDSGLHVLLEIKTKFSAKEIAVLAESVGVKVIPVSDFSINYKRNNKYPLVLISYSGIALENIRPAIRQLEKVWIGN